MYVMHALFQCFVVTASCSYNGAMSRQVLLLPALHLIILSRPPNNNNQKKTKKRKKKEKKKLCEKGGLTVS